MTDEDIVRSLVLKLDDSDTPAIVGEQTLDAGNPGIRHAHPLPVVDSGTRKPIIE